MPQQGPPPAFVCPTCGRASSDPNDALISFCAECGFQEPAAAKAFSELTAYKEAYVRAWLAETGLLPSQCELVIEPLPAGGYTLRVRRLATN